MKKFLLHDPTTIGHHLIYAENFIDWALSRKFHVYFSGNGVTKTCFYQKFKNNPHVTFITFTMSGKDSRRFYKNNGPYVQVQHIKKLQKKINPDITLFQYGDYMWDEWNRMIDTGDRFHAPTYMLLLRSNEAYYLRKETYYSTSLVKQIGKNKVFKRIMTLDEYQVGNRGRRKNLYYLPDPFKTLKSKKKSKGKDIRNLEKLKRFLKTTGKRPIILTIGEMTYRKNVPWMIKVAHTYKNLCYVQIGRWKRWNVHFDETTQSRIADLKTQERYFKIDKYVEENVLLYILKSKKVKFMMLPYENHYGSSGIQLIALYFNKPILVPRNCLMGRRTKDNNLGLVFKEGNHKDFLKKVDMIMRKSPQQYIKNIKTFMKNFTKSTLYRHLDRILLSREEQMNREVTIG